MLLYMVFKKFVVEWAQMATINKQAQWLTVKHEPDVIQIVMIKEYRSPDRDLFLCSRSGFGVNA